MDISKSIYYRGLDLNSVLLKPGRVLRGLAVETADYSNIDVVGYTEKRAAADGVHASDVYMGARTVDIAGFIYGSTQAEVFDYLHLLRSVFSPTSAYQESPGDRGFLPMAYTQPTADTVSFPGITIAGKVYPAGTIPLYMNLRPQRPLQFGVQRDRQKGTELKIRPSAMPWSIRLLAKDPRVYVNPPQSMDFTGTFTNFNEYAINRGDYETPLNIQLVVQTAPGIVGEFKVVGLNGIDMRIKIENVAKVVYRWFGDDRVLMTENIADGQPVGTHPLTLRQDLVTFANKQRRPTVPAAIDPPTKPFKTAYQRTCNVALAVGSSMFWSEAFA